MIFAPGLNYIALLALGMMWILGTKYAHLIATWSPEFNTLCTASDSHRFSTKTIQCPASLGGADGVVTWALETSGRNPERCVWAAVLGAVLPGTMDRWTTCATSALGPKTSTGSRTIEVLGHSCQTCQHSMCSCHAVSDATCLRWCGMILVHGSVCTLARDSSPPAAAGGPFARG